MREIRKYGSEGGATQINALSLPLSGAVGISDLEFPAFGGSGAPFPLCGKSEALSTRTESSLITGLACYISMEDNLHGRQVNTL